MKMILWMVMVGVSALLMACQQPVADHTLRFAIAQAPQNLDPRFASDAASERINRLIYKRLVEFDAQSKPVAGLATWQTVDAKTYRFTLKKDLPLFHHGQALTATDIKATYDAVRQLTNSPHAVEFANIAEMTVLSQDSVQFALKQADANFPEKLIIGIMPHDLLAQGHDFSRKPIGNGVFQFKQWRSQLRLVRTTDNLAVDFIEVKDPTVRVLKLLRGEVDLLQSDLPPELVKYLQTQDDVTVSFNQGTNFSYLGLNMQDATLQQAAVRQAIAQAINRDAIIKSVMVDHTRPASSILPPEHYAGNGDLVPYEYNPQKAKQLLKDAGITLPLTLTYKTSTDAQRVRLATIMQAQMQSAGIDLQIKSLDWGTFFEDVKKGQFQLYGLTWVGIKTPDIYNKVFGSQFVPPKGLNRGRYADAETDAFLVKQDWQAATQRIHQQLPYIPLWYEGRFAAYNQRVLNYQPQSDGNWDALASITLH